jgi:protein-disulfide isomerase
MKKTFTCGSITLPAAIVIAAAMIAIAIIWAWRPAGRQAATTSGPNAASSAQSQAITVNLRPITAADHILGNPNAPIRIVEYSDPSCPYCKIFTPNIEKVMDTYGESGTVAWVYRSFPLDKPDANGFILHKNAGHESQALECAATVGGNDKFWIFLKQLYLVTPSVTSQTPNGLDQTQLPVIAKFANIDVAAFNDCLTSGRMSDKVEADYTDGINAGVNGTPFNVFVLSAPAPSTLDQTLTTIIIQMHLQTDSLYLSSDRMKLAMSGAMPYDTMKTLIDALLGK